MEKIERVVLIVEPNLTADEAIKRIGKSFLNMDESFIVFSNDVSRAFCVLLEYAEIGVVVDWMFISGRLNKADKLKFMGYFDETEFFQKSGVFHRSSIVATYDDRLFDNEFKNWVKASNGLIHTNEILGDDILQS